MTLQINGEDRDFTAPLSLSALVEQLGMKQDRVAVELNRNIVPREQWDKTSLAEGDRLEIVHFVGGGSACAMGVILSEVAVRGADDNAVEGPRVPEPLGGESGSSPLTP